MEVGEEGSDWLLEAQSFNCGNILGDENILHPVFVGSYIAYTVTKSHKSERKFCAFNVI